MEEEMEKRKELSPGALGCQQGNQQRDLEAKTRRVQTGIWAPRARMGRDQNPWELLRKR